MADEFSRGVRSQERVGESSRSVSSLILREAVGRLEQDLLAASESGGGDPSLDGLAFLATLAEMSPPDLAPVPPPIDAGLLRQLWDRLRAEAVRSSAEFENLSAADLLDTWACLERAGEFLNGGGAADVPDIVSRLHSSELVVELAHDLRSPLTSVLFLCDVLRNGQSGPLTDLQRRQLGIIYGAALGLVSMASDVIELAQGGERLMEREPSPFSIRGILDALVDLVRPMVEERGLGIRVISPPEDRRLGHPVALSRVLLNLTTNALKFTEAGFVEISAQALGGSSVEFAVRDTGGGLDGTTLTQLFNPLRQKSSGRQYGLSGSGLGLAICRRLVRAMGAELQLETIPGWGTRFNFQLDLPPVPPS